MIVSGIYCISNVQDTCFTISFSKAELTWTKSCLNYNTSESYSKVQSLITVLLLKSLHPELFLFCKCMTFSSNFTNIFTTIIRQRSS